jgi:hypothetical protein
MSNEIWIQIVEHLSCRNEQLRLENERLRDELKRCQRFHIKSDFEKKNQFLDLLNYPISDNYERLKKITYSELTYNNYSKYNKNETE